MGLVWLLSACDPGGTLGVSAPGFAMPYVLAAPSQRFPLHSDVEEISGITCSQDQRHLLAVQDENGVVFVLDKAKAERKASIDFWKDGDYEGIARTGSLVYVLKNTGTLYEISGLGLPGQEVTKYNDFLNSDFDTEGLAFDSANHRLLVACKDSGGESGFDAFTRPVFAFDLESKALAESPAYRITREDIYAFLNAHDTLPFWSRMIDDFGPDEAKMEFNPSALAVHPFSGNLYVLSSAGKKMLLVMDPNGQILHVTKLPKAQHNQPEGLCFDAEGRMYIANEGKGSTPPLLYMYEGTSNPNQR